MRLRTKKETKERLKNIFAEEMGGGLDNFDVGCGCG